MVRDLILFGSGFITGIIATLIAVFRLSISARHIVGAILILQMIAWSAFHLLQGASEPSMYVFGLGAGGAMIFVPELGEFLRSLRK